jgi:hypothetical protein
MTRYVSICFYLEAGHVCYQNYNWTIGQEYFKKSLKLSNINYELVGVFGKRTKYQQKDLAQLLLKINTPSNQNTNEAIQHFDTFKPSNADMDPKMLPKVV